ncbi:Uncharacterized protein APZ42_033315 [Daphnia magna]|uniref:Uncharacterized protein n=1 Tax=Daphnia magna TaxID=35525 RepID=A0A164L8E0_9CRUS|nr:Uncharacterized protein APZ42_033315 [Daphnia magna]
METEKNTIRDKGQAELVPHYRLVLHPAPEYYPYRRWNTIIQPERFMVKPKRIPGVVTAAESIELPRVTFQRWRCGY